MIVIDGVTVDVLYSSVYTSYTYAHYNGSVKTSARHKFVRLSVNVLIVRILLLLLCRRKIFFKLSR